jgi:hypothetical protein
MADFLGMAGSQKIQRDEEVRHLFSTAQVVVFAPAPKQGGVRSRELFGILPL